MPRAPKNRRPTQPATPTVGATALRIDGGVAAPYGEIHLTRDDWTALCGSGRMRFVFPALPAHEHAGACRRCCAAVAAVA